MKPYEKYFFDIPMIEDYFSIREIKDGDYLPKFYSTETFDELRDLDNFLEEFRKPTLDFYTHKQVLGFKIIEDYTLIKLYYTIHVSNS